MYCISRAFLISSAFLLLPCSSAGGAQTQPRLITLKSHPDPNYSQVSHSCLALGCFTFPCSTFIFHSARTLVTHQYSQTSSTRSAVCLQICRWDDERHGANTDPAKVLWVPVASWELERVQRVCLCFHGDLSSCLWPSGGTSAVMSLSGKGRAKWQAELWDCWPTHSGRTSPPTTKKIKSEVRV